MSSFGTPSNIFGSTRLPASSNHRPSTMRPTSDIMSAIFANQRHDTGRRTDGASSRGTQHPLDHPLYTGYRDLQRLCLGILTHHRISIGAGERNRIYGLVFDGSWLWEEYVTTLLQERFFHPNNTTGYGAQSLFEDSIDVVYPDFISRDDNPRIIADAKYKSAPVSSSGKSNINRADRFQILAYTLRFDTPHGVFIHPLTDDAKPRTDYALASGVDFRDEPGEPGTSSHKRQVHIRGIVIPQRPSDTDEWTYVDFNKAIAHNEQAFLKSMRFQD